MSANAAAMGWGLSASDVASSVKNLNAEFGFMGAEAISVTKEVNRLQS